MKKLNVEVVKKFILDNKKIVIFAAIVFIFLVANYA
jgi:hypothetical protein|tara:strand:+ start:3391 stop:3498 length:108 start_codon:yes stop_codon:yes gene_type:complete